MPYAFLRLSLHHPARRAHLHLQGGTRHPTPKKYLPLESLRPKVRNASLLLPEPLWHDANVTLQSAKPTHRESLLALVLAALCAILLLGKSLLPGNVLVPYPPEFYDVQSEAAAANGSLDLAEIARGNLSMGDKYGQSLAWDRVLQENLQKGHIPLWNREIGGGVPFVSQMAQPYQPWNLLLFALPSEQWYGFTIFGQLVLMGCFAYGFVRRIGCRHASGCFAVVLAILGLWTQSKLHHNVMLTAALSLFPMLSATHDIMRHRGFMRSAAWLALWAGLAWLSGFIIIALQACYITAGYALLLALGNVRGERLRPLLVVCIGFALGGLLSLAQMGPLLLAIPESARPTEFNVELHRLRCLDWDFLLTFAWPDLFYWASNVFYLRADPLLPLVERPPLSQLVLLHDPNKAYGNWVECAFAMSLPALAATLLALFDRQRRLVVGFFIALLVIGFGMATGSQPFFWVARHLPGLAATDLRRELYFAAMALVVLAAIGADALHAAHSKWTARGFLFVITGLSGIAYVWLYMQDEASFLQHLAQWIAADAMHPLVQGHTMADIEAWIRTTCYPSELLNNLTQLKVTAGRTCLVAGTAAAATFASVPQIRIGIWIAAAALELWHTGRGPVQTVAALRVTTPPLVVAPVLAASQDPNGVRPRFQRLGARIEPRAAASYLPNFAAYHGIEDAASYSSLPPLREEEFFLAIEPNTESKTNLVPGGDGVAWFHDPLSLQHPLCDLFGIRFILTDQQVTAANLIDRTPTGTGRFRLLERTSTLPRATFVRSVEVIPDRTMRLAMLRNPSRDVAHQVILEDTSAPLPATSASEASPATVMIVRHEDERVELRVQNAADGYLRLADAYDAGWRALLDGAPTKIYLADHYLRAVYLPPGDHRIVFTFDAPRVLWPPRISLIALLMILGLMFMRRSTAIA
ncbi:hypothetical protein LBMAG49_02160 [Planctomycetota bacterium]|nr:hypothetical protein LBMAG49_02160 [Planctomycetota bacterium]